MKPTRENPIVTQFHTLGKNAAPEANVESESPDEVRGTKLDRRTPCTPRQAAMMSAASPPVPLSVEIRPNRRHPGIWPLTKIDPVTAYSLRIFTIESLAGR